MARYILRRLLQAIPTLLGVSVISFVLVMATPGDPILIRTFDPSFTEEARDLMRRQLGLDQPPVVQYVRWLTGIVIRGGDVAEEFASDDTQCLYVRLFGATLCNTNSGIIRGDLGTSLDTKEPVWERLVQRMPAT